MLASQGAAAGGVSAERTHCKFEGCSYYGSAPQEGYCSVHFKQIVAARKEQQATDSVVGARKPCIFKHGNSHCSYIGSPQNEGYCLHHYQEIVVARRDPSAPNIEKPLNEPPPSAPPLEDEAHHTIVSIVGATGEMAVVNGMYDPSSEQHDGRVRYVKRGDTDWWIEFNRAKSAWQLKAIHNKGLDVSWAFVRCGDTETELSNVHYRTWQVIDLDTGTFRADPSVKMLVDSSSDIFGFIKNSAGAAGRVVIGDVIDDILAKGYTQEEVQACLKEYQELGMWTLSADKFMVTFGR